MSIQERLNELLKDYNMRFAASFASHVLALAEPVPVLNFIAEETNGNCFFVQNNENWMEAFAYSVGVIESKLVEDIQAEIVLNQEGIPLVLSKVYSENGLNEFRMPDALAGSRSDTVFVVKVMPFDGAERRNEEILKVNVRYRIRGTVISEQVVLRLDILSRDRVVREIEIDAEVMLGFLRVKIADILNEASLIVCSRYDQATELLKVGMKELQESCVWGYESIKWLLEQLESCLNIESPDISSVIFRNLARNLWSKKDFAREEYQNLATMINKNRMKALFH